MQHQIPVYEPATGEVLAYVPDMTINEVRDAIDRAYEALPRVQSIPAYERARLLMRVAQLIRSRKEELARLLTREIGRPIKSTRLIIERTARIYELAAQELPHVLTGEFVPLEAYDYPPGNENRIAMIRREPIGVIGAITPFNFPPDSMAHKVAPALAMGNTVVLKPSRYSPLTESEIAKLIIEAGFPRDSIVVVTGNSSMIGDEFVSNPKIALITFTGSSKVGLELASKAILNGKRVIMELGGSDAMIILEDANLDRAVQAAIIGRFDYAGQFCNATKRLIVREEIYDEFIRRLVEGVSRLKIGDPLSEDTDIGPLISREAVETMESFVNDALSRGGRVIYRASKVPERGFYYPPTILEAPYEARVWVEEVFGPVLPVTKVKSDDEAVEVANRTEYGLDASIFTRDFSRAYRLATRIKAGTVFINDTTRLRFDNLPFGGFKKSGIGRESVRDTMMEMSEVKVITYTL